MKLAPEYLIERARNRRSLTRWKVAAIFLVIIVFFLIGESFTDESVSPTSAVVGGDYIASVEINGPIMEDLKRDAKLAALADDKRVKAVILRINSPGGGTVGAEMIFNSLKKISREKPLVAVLGSVAASGGYMIALASDHIVTHNGTVTGSIGAVMQTAEVTEMAEKLGIKFQNFKSSEFKAAPNPFEPVSPQVRQVIMENIYDVHDFFMELVAKERGMNMEKVREIADGRIFTGRQALELGLVDEVGTEENAIDWLRAEKSIDKGLKVRDYKIRSRLNFMEGFLEDFEERVQSIFYGNFSGLKSVIGF